ncbi:ABC transporter ATP-binding protein [Desertihabitans aurantiacus]|uniref:ABC transporter ATP-binding protein n=1 Tax=Desertihabitans aurantiacus TaxID=2282477 RepID=UPI000DF7FF89|nr:ABC transporter ATP-binding protein [Desertihabitans aurantiacus]
MTLQQTRPAALEAVQPTDPGPHPAPAIEVRDLGMRYGSVQTLRGVDLRVEAGEVMALLGPNGAGKTTTIEILEGFRRRSSGDVRVLGCDPDAGREAWQSRIGVVLQAWRDHRRWRVRELLHHLGRYYRPYSSPDWPRPQDPDALLAAVGLTDQQDQRVGRLSGGQRRRLDVAIGLVGNPELLFLDEPTVGFDPEARQEFHQLIRSISARGRTAIVLTTHDLVEAEQLADTVAILVDGRVVARGPMAEIAARHAAGTEIRYRLHGREHVETVPDATARVRALVRAHDTALSHLEVRPQTLEDAYLQMIRDHHRAELGTSTLAVEAGHHDAA